MKKILIYLIYCLLAFNPVLWAANFYINPDSIEDPGSQNGSFAHPYDSWADVTPSSGNAYRQLCGTSEAIAPDWSNSGTNGNEIFIGAYYDDGGAVHEDASPSFGTTCGNSAPKPIISSASEDAIDITGDYYIINSIAVTTTADSTYVGIDDRGEDNEICYCYLYSVGYGIVAGYSASYPTNFHYHHNLVDCNHTPSGAGNDGISLQLTAYSGTVEYNKIYDYDHGGIYNAGNNNTIQYNWLADGGNDAEDAAIMFNYAADSNIVRYNFTQATMGFELQGGDNNEVYGNIFNCNGGLFPQASQGCIHVQSLYSGSSYTITGNEINFNTIVYNNERSGQDGISLYSLDNGGDPDDNQAITGNNFEGNIIYTVTDDCINISDGAVPGVIDDTNTFVSNMCYAFGDQYARIEGLTYASAALFNALSFATGNTETDPQMNNPASGDYNAASGSSNMVDAGGDQSEEDWDTGLRTANWSTFSFTTTLGSDNSNRDAGAFEYYEASAGATVNGSAGATVNGTGRM